MAQLFKTFLFVSIRLRSRRREMNADVQMEGSEGGQQQQQSFPSELSSALILQNLLADFALLDVHVDSAVDRMQKSADEGKAFASTGKKFQSATEAGPEKSDDPYKEENGGPKLGQGRVMFFNLLRDKYPRIYTLLEEYDLRMVTLGQVKEHCMRMLYLRGEIRDVPPTGLGRRLPKDKSGAARRWSRYLPRDKGPGPSHGGAHGQMRMGLGYSADDEGKAIAATGKRRTREAEESDDAQEKRRRVQLQARELNELRDLLRKRGAAKMNEHTRMPRLRRVLKKDVASTGLGLPHEKL